MTQKFTRLCDLLPTRIENDVISGVAVDNVGMDIHVKFGDSRSNGFRDNRGTDFVTYERTKTSLFQ